MRLLLQTAAIVRKDVQAELRNGETVFCTVLFSFLLILVLALVFTQSGLPLPGAAAGSLWVSLALGGTLGLSRAWEREREADGLRFMLLSPTSRIAIYLAKVAGVFLFMLVAAVVVVPMVGLLFEVPLIARAWRLLSLISLGLLGFSLLGAYFGALMARARARDVLLFVVLFPLMFPLLIAGTMATAELFSPEPALDKVRVFMALLIAFDALAAVIALWTFERLVID